MGELISIVVPIYNVERYLKKCVDSIIKQTYCNLQIILVDDGSTDRSSEICDEYCKTDKRIEVIHRQNGGLSAARNSGIEVARGIFISFIDSDDYIDLDFVEKLYDSCKKNNADIAIAPRIVEDEVRQVKEYYRSGIQIFDTIDALKHLFLTDEYNMAAWDKLYRLNLFEEIRYPEGKIHEDIFTTALLIEKACRVVKIDNTFYHYIVRGNSISRCTYTHKSYDMYVNAKECYDYFINKYDLEKYVFRYYYLNTYTCIKKIIASKKSKSCIEDYQKLLSNIRVDFFKVLFNPYLSIKTKIKTIFIITQLYK